MSAQKAPPKSPRPRQLRALRRVWPRPPRRPAGAAAPRVRAAPFRWRLGAPAGALLTPQECLNEYRRNHLVRPVRGFVFSDYITLWLNSPDGTEKSSRNTYGKGVSQGNLNLSLIRNFLVPLPPLAEQRRIVAKVEQLMALVDALETQLAASRATAANLLSALVAELTACGNAGART